MESVERPIVCARRSTKPRTRCWCMDLADSSRTWTAPVKRHMPGQRSRPGAVRTERMRDMIRAVVLYAGPVAEELARRPGELPGTVAMVQACRTLPYLHGGAGRDPHHDFERVADIVRGKFGSESDSIFRYLTTAARLAEDLDRVHWETIEQVAHHALRWGTMDGEMFKSLVAGRLGRGDLRPDTRSSPVLNTLQRPRLDPIRQNSDGARADRFTRRRARSSE